MGIMEFLYHPDTILTAANFEYLAVESIAELSLPELKSPSSAPESSGKFLTRLLLIRPSQI